MSIDPKLYIHPSDKLALDALKAIPGFTSLIKAYMNIWDEKKAYIRNMATNLRINERQLKKYYDMLPPICDKLGIEIPELYLTLDVNPNAWTFGDTKPYIVITSGLLETLPDDLIPSVLAHECGHIACHHCLYTTIGSLILGETTNLLTKSDLGQFVSLPLQVAFFYWMRCSEYSADRAAAICDGEATKVINTCLRFAGYDKDIVGDVDVEEFMNQAIEYKKMMDDSKINKSLEFLMFGAADHPLNAMRAYECNEWAKNDIFNKIQQYIKNHNSFEKEVSAIEYIGELPMAYASKHYIGKNYIEVEDSLSEYGFTNITCIKTTEKSLLTKKGQVVSIHINGKDGFELSEWYPYDSEIRIMYYDIETDEEVAAAHPGQIKMPSSSKKYIGKNFETVIEELQKVGFKEFDVESLHKAKKGLLDKEGNITNISVNGQTIFNKDEWFDKEALIKITYVTFESPVVD